MELARLAIVACMAILCAAESLGQALGDFNNDGFDDVAIGVPLENVNFMEDAGAVNVIYGTQGGMRDAGNEIWHQDRPNIADACEVGDRFGSSLTVGDFNNDNIDDLAIGAPGELTENFIGGVVHVLYGSANGLVSTGSELWRLARDGPDVIAATERYGASIAAGDFDRDGFDDLAVGIPGMTIDENNGAGAVDILFGHSTGLILGGRQFWHQDSEGIKGKTRPSDYFGAVVASADFDRDGYWDLAVSAPGDNPEGVQRSGAVHVLYGTTDGIGELDDQLFHQGDDSVTGLGDEPELDDQLGLALTVGDFDGDFYPDLAIGVPEEDLGTVELPLEGAGLVHVIYGSTGSGLTLTDKQTWTADSEGILDSAEERDRFGSSLTAGDFDDDGRDDLAIGAPGETRFGLGSVGIVHVIYGWASGLHRGFNQVWHQNATDIHDEYEANDRFGASVAAGDVTGDGNADLVIGVPGENPSFVPLAGAIHLLFGSDDNLTATLSQYWHQNTRTTLDQCEAGDSFGDALPR